MKRIALLAAVLTAGVMASGCKVVVTGQSTYEVCDFDSDCNDPLDSCVSVSTETRTDAQCSRGCVDDLDCPGTGHCVAFPGSAPSCFQTCITNAICEPGWACTDLSDGSAVCLPGAGTPPPPPGIPPYNTCTSPGTTGGCSTESDGCAAVSVDGVTGAFCTSNCATSSECPADSRGFQGVCLRFGSNPSICFESCVTDDDCLLGYSCKPPDVGLQPVCLPTG